MSSFNHWDVIGLAVPYCISCYVWQGFKKSPDWMMATSGAIYTFMFALLIAWKMWRAGL